MNKLITATAIATLFATGAFAEGVQTYNRTAMETMAGGDKAVVDIMMDEDGMDRTDADFQARWDAATPEQQATLKDTCAKGIEDKVEFSETGATRCKIVTTN
ncbi:hypothetical protein WNZ14_05145 [Hoeflea sp. AS60]|uniref:hypothetical protein n=1 Tax=Hoeflea sp. AS60 TaxID=3135780 RepID=UPI0031706A16